MVRTKSQTVKCSDLDRVHWICLPGTWKQALPAAVTADPSSGTIPTDYLILNVTQGTLKRHAGGYSWEVIVGATGGKIGFYGVTPVTQPAGASQAAVTLTNTDGAIGGLTISDRPTQAEVQALRDKCEEPANDVRAFSAQSPRALGLPRHADCCTVLSDAPSRDTG